MLKYLRRILNHRRKPTLQLWPGAIVFITGAVIMILELVGSRIVAPYFGTSTFVWTGLIGVILGFLSLGYWLGGKLADHYLSSAVLASIILAASASLVLLSFISRPLLETTQALFPDIRIAISVASIALFGLPTLLLAMVTPYTTRLAITQLKTSGEAVGTIYALSTLGSIVGTFMTGFFLLAWFGSQTIILLLAALLLVTASVIAFFFFQTTPLQDNLLAKMWLIAVLGLLIGLSFQYQALKQLPTGTILDQDTAYQRIRLWRARDPQTKRPLLFLSYGPHSAQSGIYLDVDDDLVFSYTRFFRLGAWFKPDLTKALMIGGGGYSYPKEFLKTFPEATIDVVEIDPAVTKIAYQYFELPESERLTTYNQDGRQFLLTAETSSYDIVYLDAFGSNYSVPFHLTTLETITQFDRILNQNGMVIMNIISAVEGNQANFFQAEYATYQQVFPYLYTFQVQENVSLTDSQNLILVASKQPLNLESNNPFFQQYLSRHYQEEITPQKPYLTDAFAPVEHYLWPLQKANWK